MVKEAKKGYKITHAKWSEDVWIKISRDGKGSLVYGGYAEFFVNKDGSACTFLVNDYLSTDWKIYNDFEGVEFFGFKKAVKLMEKGKYVSRKRWNTTDIIYLDKNNKIFKMYYGGNWHPDYYDYKAEDWYECFKGD